LYCCSQPLTAVVQIQVVCRRLDVNIFGGSMVAFKHLETMYARVTLGMRNDLAVEKYTAGGGVSGLHTRDGCRAGFARTVSTGRIHWTNSGNMHWLNVDSQHDVAIWSWIEPVAYIFTRSYMAVQYKMIQ